MAERAHPHDPVYRGTIYEERLQERYASCLPFIAGKDVLDVPCGTGWGTSMLTGAALLTGVDIDPSAIAFGKRNYPEIRFVEGTMRELPFPGPPEFDVVICLEGLEHVYLTEAREFLAEAHRVLRPEGCLIVTVPLLNEGRHSGNPYHAYEFTAEEIRALLTRQFREVRFEIFQGPEGPEVRFVGMRREVPLAASPHDAPAASHPVYGRLYQWLMTQDTGNGFHFAAGSEQTLISTSCGILLLESLGRLDEIPAARKQAWAGSLRDCQDEATGLFADPLLARFPVESSDHDVNYLSLQTTYFALHALDALGEHPSSRLGFLDRLSTPEALSRWMEELEWQNPWLESNRVMFVLGALVHRAEEEGDERAPGLVHHALDWLDLAQDPETGLWGVPQGASLLNAMAGAYHFVPFYEYVNRPVRHVTQIIDSALRLQRSDSLFAADLGGGACEDLDAIDLLATLTRQSSYRAEEVKRALVRSFWAIWNLQNEDGGFPYARTSGTETYRFSSWQAMEVEKRASDVWSGWFRGLALATIACTYPGDLPELGPWRFRRRPVLGYHRERPGLTGHERSVLRIWLRRSEAAPLPGSATPAVTVVIPCYNLGRYLPEAIGSVLVQTFRDVEIVIVDDGSTDEFTIRLLEDFDQPGMRVVRQENKGLPAARNAGIAQARGRYIACLDADDLYAPTFLEKAVAVLDERPEVGFVTSHYRTFDGYEQVFDYPSCDLPEMLAKNRAMVSALFRREAWSRAGGYCEDLAGMQDWDFWLSLLEAGYRPAVIPEVLFHYRIRPDSMYATTRKPERFGRLLGQIAERHAAAFARHLREVVEGRGGDFSVLLEQRQEQRLEILRVRDAGERALADLQSRLRQVEGGKAWLEQQFINWQRVAEERSQELDHLRSRLGEIEDRLSQGSQQVMDLQTRLAARDSRLADQQIRLSARDRRSASLQAQLAEREDQIASLRAELAAREQSIQALLTSTSWRIAAPLRFAGRTFTAGLQNLPLRPGTGLWSTFRSAYRLLPLPRRTKERLLQVALRKGFLNPWAASPEQGQVALPQPAEPAVVVQLQEPWPAAEPLVSVVIPCYNYGHFVAEAVDSVLAQTFQDLEIIVVDGGSCRDSVQALRAMQRPKTRIYFREGRHLVGDNRNFGISEARGKYICCLDADDLIRPTYLEKAVFLLETQGYDVVSTSIHCFGDSTTLYAVSRFPVLTDMVRGNHVSTCAVFRKDLWADAGGFQDSGIGQDYVYEDWRLWIRISALGARIANIVEESLFRYRVHSRSSLSRQDETVPSLSRQHEAVVELNRDVLTEEAFQRSEQRRWQRIQVLASLVNLRRRIPEAEATTVLFALPFLFVGGAERLISEISLHLRSRGYRIVVVTTVPVDPKFGDSTEWFERATAEIYHLPRFLDPEWWREFIFYLIETKNVSLLWLAGSAVFYDLLPEIRAEWPGLKVVDLLFNTIGHTANNRKHRELIDVTVVENREVHDWLLQAGEAPERVLLIPSGVDLERYRPGPKPDHFLAELGIDPSSFIVGFSGRMSEEKSPESFLEIADRCRDDSRFVFLMTGAGPLAESIRHRIESLGLGDRLRFLGKVEDVRQVLALYDVLVLPSRLDGRPVVVLESLAMGVPVVASRVGGLPELVREGETGFLCEPGDVSGFADRVRWLAAHPEEHRRMRQAARSFAESGLDAERMLRRYEEAVRGVLTA